jgi:hypothetical protein
LRAQRDDAPVMTSPTIKRQHGTRRRVFFLLRRAFGDVARARTILRATEE